MAFNVVIAALRNASQPTKNVTDMKIVVMAATKKIVVGISGVWLENICMSFNYISIRALEYVIFTTYSIQDNVMEYL